MGNGYAYRGICPKCFGGANKERSFSLRRAVGAFTFKCFRNGCGIWGRVPVHGTCFVDDTKPKPVEINPYSGRLVPVPKPVLDLTGQRWGMNYVDMVRVGKWQWSEELAGLYMPFINLNGTEIGGQIRKMDKEKKVLSYKSADEPIMSWYTRRESLLPDLTIYVVEDIPSAIKLSRHVPIAISLVGTDLSLAKVEKILQASSKLALMLDEDATVKAFDLRKQLGVFFERFDVIALNGPDIKDRNDEQIISLVVQNDSRNRYSGRSNGFESGIPVSDEMDST